MKFTTFAMSLCGLFLTLASAWSQSSLTEHTFQLDEGATSPSANIQDIDFLHGFWSGEGLGGSVDESWSLPAAGTIVGTFRLVKDNQIEFSEFLEISQKQSSLVLKVKHFDREFKGWEEKDKFAEFQLVRVEENAAYFDGLTYLIDDEGRLHAHVAMKQKDGTVKEGSFLLQRQTTGNVTELATLQQTQTVAIDLPDDPEAVVLSYNTEGGYRVPTPAGFEPTPLFRLLANGKVLVGRRSADSAEVEYQMTKEELDAFLQFVITENRIFDITTDGLIKQIDESGKPVRVADAATERFSVNLANKKHEVESYGLMIIHKIVSRIKDLQALAAIRNKCMFLRSRAALGPQDKVDDLLKNMEASFKKRFAEGEPLTLDDLKSADVNKDGDLQAQFTRVDYQNGHPQFIYNCFVQKKNGKKPKFNFSRSLVR